MTHTRRFRSKKNRTMKKRHMKNKTRRGGVPKREDQYVKVVSHAPGHMPKNRPSYRESYNAPYLPEDHGKVVHVQQGYYPAHVEQKRPSLFARGVSKVTDFKDEVLYNLTKRHNIQNMRAKERDTILGAHNARLMRESGIHKK